MKFEVTHNNRILTLIESTDLERKQLNLSLTKKIEYYNFLPIQVKKNWNGIISYFHKDKYVPIGLWQELIWIAETYKFDLDFQGLENIFYGEISFDEFVEWVDEKFDGSVNAEGIPFIPKDYQVDTAYKILCNKLSLSELTTAAGKSLIMFICLMYFQEKQLSKKSLIIVPSVDLVIQAFEDFHEYNSFLKPENRFSLNIKQIHGGEKKDFKAIQNIHISTFQSLVNLPDDYFTAFDTVVVDECLHPDSLITMSDNTLKKISEIQIGDSVVTTNDKTGLLENKQVDYVYKNLSKHQYVYELELQDGSILELTGNHKVKLLDSTYKRVDELDGTEQIITHYSFCEPLQITKKKHKGDVYNLRIDSEDGNNHNYFANGINVANCHKTKAKSIKDCLSKCKNADRKFGLTGTIAPQGTLDNLTLQAYLGPIVKVVKAKQLQSSGDIADIEIAVVEFDYPEDIKTKFDAIKKQIGSDRGKLLKIEQDYIITYKPRIEKIAKILNKIDKNQLVLFHRQVYGKELKKYLENNSDKEIHFIYGEIDKNKRNEIKALMKVGSNKILIASFGVLSTGVSIKNIHYIHLTESFKSDIIIRQSIGRGLRLHKDKDKLRLFDYIDVLNTTRNNILMDHSRTRKGIYKDQGFTYNIKKVSL
jgi:superfamily II DNA or RNA helicase